MINIKLYGKIRAITKQKFLEIDGDNIELKRVLGKISSQLNNITAYQLNQCVIFVNGTAIDKLRGYATVINNGDEVALLSPVSGG